MLSLGPKSGAEFSECLCFFAVSKNLVTYITTVLHESNVDAARNVSTWQATCFLMPLGGAVVADSYCGRYRTMVVSCSVGVAVRSFQPLCTATNNHSPPESESLCHVLVEQLS